MKNGGLGRDSVLWPVRDGHVGDQLLAGRADTEVGGQGVIRRHHALEQAVLIDEKPERRTDHRLTGLPPREAVGEVTQPAEFFLQAFAGHLEAT